MLNKLFDLIEYECIIWYWEEYNNRMGILSIEGYCSYWILLNCLLRAFVENKPFAFYIYQARVIGVDRFDELDYLD